MWLCYVFLVTGAIQAQAGKMMSLLSFFVIINFKVSNRKFTGSFNYRFVTTDNLRRNKKQTAVINIRIINAFLERKKALS